MRQVFSIAVLVIGSFVYGDLIAASFPLSDSSPNSQEFRNRFMASYGVNEAIEPKLKTSDRSLQEAIMPHIRNNPRTAIQLIERALNSETNPAFYSILGNLYYQVNDYGASERYLRQALTKFPSLRRAWRTLALTYVQRNRLAEAIAPLLKVIELGGGDAQSYGLLGYSYLSEEKYESALSAYRMARMFKPDSLDFRRGQAHCLLQTEQHRLAVSLFDELIADNPEETSFWLAQANAFLALEQRDEAIANLQIVADSGRGTWESGVMLGDLYLNEGVPKLALDSYVKAFQEKAPREADRMIRPLTNLVSVGLYEEARSYLALVRNRLTGPLEAGAERDLNVAEARIEMRAGDPEKAVLLLRPVVEKDPLDGAGLLLMGEYYQNRAEFDQAEFYFERAVTSREFAVDAHIALGRLAVEQGDLAGALAPLRRAIQLRADPSLQKYVEAIEGAVATTR